MNAAHIHTQPPTGEDAPTAKDFATVQAQFAIRGHQLIHDHNPLTGRHDYLINRWGWTRHIDNWPEVLEVLKQIGGAV